MRRFSMLNLFVLAAAMALATGSSAQASVGIDFGATQSISGPSDVIAPGAFTDQVGYLFNGAGPQTIDGVSFVNSPNNMSPLDGTYNQYYQNGNTTIGPYANTTYAILLNNGDYRDNTSASVTVNVTPGVTYEVGVWAYDDRGCCQDRSDVLTGAGVGGTPGVVAFGLGTSPAGSYVWGTFTANSTTEIINFSAGSNNEQVNGIVLATANVSPTPEPTSIAVWGLAIAGGLFVARRRRKA